MQLSTSNWYANALPKRQCIPIAMYWWAFVDICLTLVLYLMQSFYMSHGASLPSSGIHHATKTGDIPTFSAQLHIVLTDRTIELNQEVIGHFDENVKQPYDLDQSGCITQLLRKLSLLELEQQTSFQPPQYARGIPLIQASTRTPFYVLHQTLHTLACAGFHESNMLTTE